MTWRLPFLVSGRLGLAANSREMADFLRSGQTAPQRPSFGTSERVDVDHWKLVG